METASLLEVVERTEPRTRYGKVVQIVGLVVESLGPAEIALGELCLIGDQRQGPAIQAEVVGFRGERVLLMPLAEIEGVRPGTPVFPTRRPFSVPVGEALRGRILDGLGRPLDERGPLKTAAWAPVYNQPPAPLSRRRVRQPLGTGVRAIDGLVTCGKGQRLGIFAGSGVGKSTLMGMIARHSEADVNVIALVGERGKEVLDFIEDSLGEDGLRRSVVVVATSDQPALIRLKAAFVATAIAEYFRDQGQDVMLMMDSLTRMAMAQREIGLAAGEPPTTKGYTPSVFALLPRLLERAGMARQGSITGLYTVLVEGDDMDDPIADASRAILDGHLVLSRRLASRGHYPPIEVMESVSRSMGDVVDEAHWEQALQIKTLLAAYAEAEDLINIGAYARGSNPQVDRALQLINPINAFLQQRRHEGSDFAGHVGQLHDLTQGAAQ
ncbi:MAG: flagellar protein export ATPase FliI [Candidatus Latescibacteria bacterium]|nr:flagellar protein export ATPase FliI [Candidatus Latescibacterota bacterium]